MSSLNIPATITEIIGISYTGTSRRQYATMVVKLLVGDMKLSGVLYGPHRKTEARAQTDVERLRKLKGET